ncbi:MAG: hypothetical protein AAF221_03330 [Pseudomonadota bacterium]
MPLTDIASYCVAAGMVSFSVYLALGDMQRMDEAGAKTQLIRLQFAVVAAAIVALIGLVLFQPALGPGKLSLVVLAIAVAAFYIASSLHRRAFPKGPRPFDDEAPPS